MPQLSLVLLAAGLGTRFGGPKQLAPVGVDNEPLLCVTAAQAEMAGFEHLVVVTRSSLRADVRDALDEMTGELGVTIVLQDDHGPDRSAPWGTAHAVACCSGTIDGPFGVANADDYYGDPSFTLLAEALRAADDKTAVIIGFEVGRTMSPHGGVARGVCRLEGDKVVGVTEARGLVADGNSVADATGARLDASTPVSMNLWGLPGWVAAEFAESFERFAQDHRDNPKIEFLLPAEIDRLRAEERLEIQLVMSSGPWAGLTFRDDIDDVRHVIAEAHRSDTD